MPLDHEQQRFIGQFLRCHQQFLVLLEGIRRQEDFEWPIEQLVDSVGALREAVEPIGGPLGEFLQTHVDRFAIAVITMRDGLHEVNNEDIRGAIQSWSDADRTIAAAFRMEIDEFLKLPPQSKEEWFESLGIRWDEI